MSTLEELQSKFRVKVTKKTPDTRISIAGTRFIEPGSKVHDGTRFPAKDGELAAYCIIPTHAADVVKKTNKMYDYSEPFIPSAITATAESNATCPNCGKVCANEFGLQAHMRSCKAQEEV